MGPTMVDLVLSVNVYGVNCASAAHIQSQNTTFCCRNATKQLFCLKELNLWHFCRECRKILNINAL